MSRKDHEGPADGDGDADVGAAPVEAKKAVWPRLLGVAALFVGLMVVAQITGLADQTPAELIAKLRELMASAGGWGFLLLTVLFVLAELLHLPGMLFIAAAVLSYGQLVGGIVGYVSAVLAVSFTFGVVRTVGGSPLEEMENRWVQRILSKLDDRPIRTVALLRVPLSLAPQLSYAFALSSVKFRDHLIGSAIGLVPMITLFVVLFDRIIRWLGWIGA